MKKLSTPAKVFLTGCAMFLFGLIVMVAVPSAVATGVSGHYVATTFGVCCCFAPCFGGVIIAMCTWMSQWSWED